ncbi:MAG: hypothetical protein LBT24_00305 [Tannerella sp.]|jgi:hypothetical protein|nr:hypothetical protein [Tannerella sp.]
MDDLLTYIFYVIAANERARIDEADANPNKWYELFITHEDGSTETVEKCKTMAEMVPRVENYASKYRFDCINIVIMENQKSPASIFRFFTDALIYSLILDYFRHLEKLRNMRFVGEIRFPEDGSAPKFKKEYYNYGEVANIFIDEIAFSYFHNMICYIPDLGEEEKTEDGCTYNDFLEIAEGNEKIARHLFDEVTWEYPSTLYEQWESYGTLDELEKVFKEQTTLYSYVDSGDLVHCNNCDTSMLVPIGADKCPACHFEGALAWVDDNRQEASLSELDATGEFNITVKNEPESVEYLSVEVLRDEYEMDTEEICRQIIHVDRSCEKYEWEQYKNERRSVFPQLDSTEKILQDFDDWKGQSALEYEKIQDANYWASL